LTCGETIEFTDAPVDSGSEEAPASVRLEQLGCCERSDQIMVPKVGVSNAGAADGQQPVSVTTGEPARKLWRIMTADPSIDGH
jgi:hypothetical protein